MMTATATSVPNGVRLLANTEFEAAAISGVRKAAILVMALGEELAATLFKSLSDVDLRRVTEEISHVGEVPAELLTQVLTEFYGLLETEQYMVRGGPDYAARLLTEAFGAERANEFMTQAKSIRERTTGDLAILQKMEPQQLSKFLENEHPQTVALVLAHLDARQGAGVLLHLGPELRVEAVRRLADLRQFSPEMAQKVALVLHRRMDSLGSTGRKSYRGYKAVADLLNLMDQAASKGILEQIEQQEPAVAIEIRTLMFTFEDLLTVPQQSIRELVGAADKRMLGTALKGGRENVKAHLLQGMSSRAAEMLKDDMDAMGPIRSRDVSAAQQKLLALANKLEAEGKIILRMETDLDLAI